MFEPIADSVMRVVVVTRCLSKCVKSFLQFKTTLFTQDPQGISQAAMSTTRSLPSGDPRFASAARYLRSS